MNRDGFISLGVILAVIGLLVATDSGVADRYRQIGAAASGAIVLLIVHSLLVPKLLRRVLVRTVQILLPVAVVVVLVVIALVSIPDLDRWTLGALIAATIAVAGWLVTFLTQEMRRAQEAHDRREDMIGALIAEIENILKFSNLLTQSLDRVLDDVKAKFAADATYEPFILYGHDFSTLKRVMAEIEILHDDQIIKVQNLFHVLDRLERIEASVRTPEFRGLPQDRKRDAIIRYMTIQAQVPKACSKALVELDGQAFGHLEEPSR
ncbi:hypothetical protein [Pseudooceanicola sp.]|uniref:hypothetical protein n=1 Tax=Pseudooceanicola sp. TaxID=1914328 RepID=UPI0035C68D32